MRKETIRLCAGCREEPRLARQRYGRRCKNEANRKYRARLMEMVARARESDRADNDPSAE